MAGMKIYVINLARRPDRLAEMSAQLEALGLPFERIDAVDAMALDDAEIDRHFAPRGPLGALGKGDKACTLSHFKTMRRMLEDGVDAAIVLEDDAELAQDFPAVARDAGWIPPGAKLVKLETYLTRDLKVLLGPQIGRVSGRALRPLLSRHSGTGGYAVTAAGAKAFLEALEAAPPAAPIDHLLFNANVAPTAALMTPVQMEPSMVRQRREELGTDVGALRKKARPTGLAYWKRETIRGFYEIRLLHRQAAAFLLGGARLVRPRYSAASPLGNDGAAPLAEGRAG